MEYLKYPNKPEFKRRMIMRKKSATLLLLVLLIALPASGAFALGLVNGDFSNNLNGWTAGGSVSTTTGAVTLSDNNVFYSFLYQEADFVPGSYTLAFDYKIQSLGIAPSGGQSAFNDLFSASLYFANSLGQIDPMNNIFPNLSDAIDLLSLDNNSVNTDWQHFSLTFANIYAYIIPTFELMDQNFIDNDSAVLIDNVSIAEATTPVPEPATLLLLGGGLLALFGISRRRARVDV